mgnify:CR=1 FL=1
MTTTTRASSAREMVSAFVALNGFFALLSAVLVAASLVWPHALLWILGKQYSGLVHELPWMVVASSLSAWSTGLYGVGAARGWIVPAVLMIPLGTATVDYAKEKAGPQLVKEVAGSIPGLSGYV